MIQRVGRRHAGALARIVVLVVLGVWLLVGCDADEAAEPKIIERVKTDTPVYILRSVTAAYSHGVGTFRDCNGRFGWGPRYDYDVVAWSPDGSTVYFTYGWDLYGVTADGLRLWLIAAAAPPDWEPDMPGESPATSFAVAPNGSHLVYAGCRYPPGVFTGADGREVEAVGFGFELVRITRDGGSVERLTANGGVDFYPAWSPDGRRIAYVSNAELVASDLDAALADPPQARPSQRIRSDLDAAWAGLYTMAADGTDIRPVLDEDFAVLHHPPAWSPDGRHLAVVRYAEEESALGPKITDIGRELYVVGADGAEPRRVAANVVSGPSWSPDGQRLAIAQAEADGVGLYVIGIDGTESRRVMGIERWQAPRSSPTDPAAAWIDTVAWSPDGTRILVRSNYEHPALVVSVESGETTEVGSGLRLDGRMWVRAAAWSPDGSRIAMTGGGDLKKGERPKIVGTVAADGTDAKVLVMAGARGVPFAVAAQEELDVAASQAMCADGTLVPDPGGNAGLVRDCQVLLGLRDALFGRRGLRSNWSPGTPMARWVGVTITGTPPRVTALELAGAGLWGGLPPALGDLTALRVLDLSGNFLPRSPIPAGLGDLSQLRTLRLGGSNLAGPIPPALGRLTNLETLDLSNNPIMGAIPPELGQLTNLTELNLKRDYLTGAIPPELGQLVNVRTLNLQSNELSGDIPAELGRLPNLEEVGLRDNLLTGCVPPALRSVQDSDLHLLGLPDCEPA